MRISILCGVFAMVLAAAAAAADEEQWGFVKSDRDVQLFYGVPESEAVTLSFVCEPKRKRMAVITTVLPPDTRPKRSGKIRLSNGSSSLEYAGKTARPSNDGAVYIQASIALDPRVFALLETGTSLVVQSLGARESIPLDRIKEPLSQMRQACR
jgi:hypothetical protein